MLLLSASRLDVRWFIYSVRTYNFDPSNRSSDRTSKLFTSLDRSGNSLATHLPFCHLCSLQCVESSRKAKNGTACEIGTEGRESLPLRASDRCVIHGGKENEFEDEYDWGTRRSGEGRGRPEYNEDRAEPISRAPDIDFTPTPPATPVDGQSGGVNVIREATRYPRRRTEPRPTTMCRDAP